MQITPPEIGDYFLKVYAKPEAEILSEHDTLDHVATFLIHAQQVSQNVNNRELKEHVTRKCKHVPHKNVCFEFVYDYMVIEF